LIALDTNILAYAATKSDIDGRHQATVALLAKLASLGAIVPLPVFGEFFNACRKKKLLDPNAAAVRVELWAALYNCPAPIIDDYLEASKLSALHNLQYFDALVITVAARAGAPMLLSEDMQDGLEVAGLRIVNPFAVANDALLADYFGSYV
jgi:predicted nucleic acid-binding protein